MGYKMTPKKSDSKRQNRTLGGEGVENRQTSFMYVPQCTVVHEGTKGQIKSL